MSHVYTMHFYSSGYGPPSSRVFKTGSNGKLNACKIIAALKIILYYENKEDESLGQVEEN